MNVQLIIFAIFMNVFLVNLMEIYVMKKMIYFVIHNIMFTQKSHTYANIDLLF